MPTKPTKKHRDENPQGYGEEKILKLSVAGMAHHITPATTEALDEEVPIACRFKREPENPHDANAIQVHLDRWRPGLMIGYVPRDVAAKLAPLLDQDAIRISSVWLTEVFPSTSGGDLVVGFRKKIS